MNKHEVFADQQYGFKSGRSTTQAVTDLVTCITENADNHYFTASIFIDVAKAFDSVDHNIILQKLHHYGIRGTAYEWFLSYLSGRQQYVTFQNRISSTKAIKCGVPQGSVLGPLLFLIFINDLPKSSVQGKFVLFADDTTIIYSDKDSKLLIDRASADLQGVYSWFLHNNLSLNNTKTKYMIFHNSTMLHRTAHETTLRINNQAVERCDTVNVLGVTLSQDLSWKNHINNVSRSISRGIGAIFKAKDFAPKFALRQLYFSLIHSKLTYGIQLWGHAPVSHTNILHTLQKRAIRLICGKNRTAHSSPLFQHLKILRLDDIYKLEICKFTHSLFFQSQPTTLSSLLTTAPLSVYNTRTTFRTPFARTAFKKNSLIVQMHDIWNNLPDYIKSIPRKHLFVKTLKNYMLHSYL